MDRLGFVRYIESVYYMLFGDLDSADSADFEFARNLSLPSLDTLISHVLSFDDFAYLCLPLSVLVSITCQKNHRSC